MTIDRHPLARDEEPFVMATLVPAHLPDPVALAIPDDEVTQPLPLTTDELRRSSAAPVTRLR